MIAYTSAARRCRLPVLLAMLCGSAASAHVADPPALIPMPAALRLGTGHLTIRSGDVAAFPAGDETAGRIARHATALVARLGGPALETGIDRGRAPVRFQRAAAGTMVEEAYRLNVTPRGIVIEAATDAGLFDGAMTFVQLLTGPGHSASAASVPALTIRDAPRFAWRGVMLDVARHMMSLDEIRTVIDMMAQHKLNILQLHLTDDQGWRIEIKRFPELTRIGGWREPPSNGGPEDGKRYGGFYTQEDLRSLVQYAADRSVTIVPEIDMPGHAQAAVAAMPRIGTWQDRPGVSPDWGVNPYLFGPGDDAWARISSILDEVLAIFPSRYIHIGGDEALKEQWKASPAVQAQIRSLGLANEEALQGWFVARLGRYLASHGRRLIGWDEILDGGVPATASVMSWRGEDGAIKAAGLGHDVVLSPGPILYLDNLQSDHGDEPPGRLAIQSLKTVYGYDPMPKAIAPENAGHVLGAQANLWSEYMVGAARVDHALFPRIDALSEITWSPPASRDWTSFLHRLEPQMARYRRQNVGVADSAFATTFTPDPDVGGILRRGGGGLIIANQAAYGTIRYTRDGQDPTAKSRRYEKPLAVSLGETVSARTFGTDGQALSATRRYHFAADTLLTRDSAALPGCPGPDIRLRLPLAPDTTGGAPAYDVNLYDSCWIYPAAPLDRVDGIAIRIGRIARNFALVPAERKAVTWRYNPTRYGSVVVRRNGCDGMVVASMALPDPGSSPPTFTLQSALPASSGAADLCIVTIPPENGPIYGVDSVRLVEKTSVRPIQ